MKKLFICGTLLFSSFFLTISCQKNQVNPKNASENSTTFDFRTDERFNYLLSTEKDEQTSNLRIDNSKIFEITNIQDEEVRKLAIATLTSEEKADFWNYVVEYHIENDNYTTIQKNLLTALKNATVKNAFFQNENLRTVLNSVFVPLIKIQLNNAGISDAKISAAFADGRLIYNETPVQKPGPGGQKLNCDCNGSAVFTMCSSCKSTDNCTKRSGCGFLLMYECDGLCPKYLPTNYDL